MVKRYLLDIKLPESKNIVELHYDWNPKCLPISYSTRMVSHVMTTSTQILIIETLRSIKPLYLWHTIEKGVELFRQFRNWRYSTCKE